MGGQLGYELDVTKMSDDELSEVKQQIKEYKSVRDIVHNGELYRTVSPFETNNCSWIYAKEDKSAAVLFYFTIANSPSRLPKRVTFRGLDPNQ